MSRFTPPPLNPQVILVFGINVEFEIHLGVNDLEADVFDTQQLQSGKPAGQ